MTAADRPVVVRPYLPPKKPPVTRPMARRRAKKAPAAPAGRVAAARRR